MNIVDYIKTPLKKIRSCILANLLNDNVKYNYKIIRNNFKGKHKINVVFLMQFPEMWNSSLSVYNAMLNDDFFSVKILCIPKKDGVPTDDAPFAEKNEAFEFCIKNGYQCESYDFGKGIESYLPEKGYLFLQRPYNHDLPDKLKLQNLSRNALLCYIPYGYEFVNGVHLKIEYNYVFLANVYMIFAENNCTREYIERNSKYELKLGCRKVEALGYPRFDMIKSVEHSKECSTFLWLPRWSVSDENDKSNFMNYYDCLIRYFEEHPEVYLIIRPHPLMFGNFVKSGLMSEERVQSIKNQVDLMPNVSWDSNSDYLMTFSKSDALIADFTSLLIEFFLTKKPIIYCGAYDSFNAIGKLMQEGMYCVSDWSQLISELDCLTAGQDDKFDTYTTLANQIYNPTNSIGQLIKQAIIEDIC